MLSSVADYERELRQANAAATEQIEKRQDEIIAASINLHEGLSAEESARLTSAYELGRQDGELRAQKKRLLLDFPDKLLQAALLFRMLGSAVPGGGKSTQA